MTASPGDILTVASAAKGELVFSKPSIEKETDSSPWVAKFFAILAGITDVKPFRESMSMIDWKSLNCTGTHVMCENEFLDLQWYIRLDSISKKQRTVRFGLIDGIEVISRFTEHVSTVRLRKSCSAKFLSHCWGYLLIWIIEWNITAKLHCGVKSQISPYLYAWIRVQSN